MNRLKIKFLKLFLNLSTNLLWANCTIINALEETAPTTTPTPAARILTNSGVIDTSTLRIIVPHPPHDTELVETTEITAAARATETTVAYPRTSSKTSTRKLTPRPGSVAETHIHSSTCATCFNTKVTEHTGPKRDCAHCFDASPGTCDCLRTISRADTK